MTATNYRPCLDHVLRWEGGFVDHPKDPGGATNLGITRATLQRHRGRHVTAKDVRALQLSEAAEIYRAGYWMPVRGDDLPKGLDLVAFDAGVNSGPARGARWLQAGLRVPADGRVGPQTLKAARNAPDTVAVIQRACAARMGFLQRLGTWSTFGRGWSRRVADTEAAAVAMCATRAVVEAQIAPARAAQKRDAGGAAASGTGGGAAISLEALPDWANWGVAALVIALAVLLLLKSIHHKRRAEAYAAIIAGGTHG